MSSHARITYTQEVPMLVQEKISDPDTLLKLSVAVDAELKVVCPYL
jgi:hypothetical protein